MSDRMIFTILGSGSSGGVPRADGFWGACDPAEPRNRRSRCSFLVERISADGRTTVLVDTSPDLRLQTAGAGVSAIDAVLYTHDHADQAHGIDDLRAFWITSRRRMPCYMDRATRAVLEARFGYIFHSAPVYPAICEIVDLPPHHTAWTIEGAGGTIPVMTFDMDHGTVRSVGYRFGPVAGGGVAYCSDVVAFPPESEWALEGLEVLIVDALHERPTLSHAHVGLALEWAARFKPQRTILTNLHTDLDYRTLAARLPSGVEPAFDGLRFETEMN